MRFELLEREELNMLCAKSVSMTYSGNLHRGKNDSRLL